MKLNFQLHDQQLAIANSPARFKICAAGRRSGKTYYAAISLLVEGLKNESNGYNLQDKLCFYVSPTFDQSKRVIWDLLKRLGGYGTKESVIESVLENQGVIRLVNGRKIELKGSDKPDMLRGVGLSYVVLDEYAFMKPDVWEQILAPTLTDVEGNALFIGCVRKDTLIIGENGIEEIGTAPIGYSEENKKVYGLGGFHTAEKRYGNPSLETRKITSTKGFEIEATTNHRLWTPDGWKRTDELKPGDRLYIQYNQQSYGETYLKPDFAYLLGLYLAEGSLERNIYRTTITNKDDEIQDFLRDKFGFNCLDGIHCRKNSKEFMGELLKYFPDAGNVKAKGKALNKKVFSFDKDTMSHFLSGYFDGDGCAHKNKQNISCVSASEKLIQQLQIILLNMGMLSSIKMRISKPTKRVKKECVNYLLTSEGRSAYRFSRDIGFRLTRKQKLTDNWVEGGGHQVWFDRGDFGVLTGQDGYLKRVNKVSQSTLARVQELSYNEGYDADLLSDVVKSVEISECETFDFCIPETHSYFSNGFVSHNTPDGRNHFYDLYKAAEKDPEWDRFTFKSTQNPTLSSKEIEKARGRLSKSNFKQEYEASFDATEGIVFDESQFQYLDEEPPEGTWYIAVDPAGFGDIDSSTVSKLKNLDECAIACVKVGPYGWYVGDVIHGRWGTRKTATMILRAAQKYRAFKVGIEKGSLKNAIMPFLQDEMSRIGTYPKIIEVTHGGQKKTERIVWALEGRFDHGRLWFSDNSNIKELEKQLLEFPNPLCRDDLIDALAYIDQIAVTDYDVDEEEEEDEWEEGLCLTTGY